jgi:membrane protease YdiL (CAAX protease family)
MFHGNRVSSKVPRFRVSCCTWLKSTHQTGVVMKGASRIRKLVLNVSDRTELWVVLLLAFGPAIYVSLAAAFTHGLFSDSDWSSFVNTASEVAVLGFVVWISRVRGWSIRELGLHPSWRLTAIGMLLFPATVIILVGSGVAIRSLVPSSFNHPHVRVIGLSLPSIFAVSIINPLFEETLVCGYIIQRLVKKGAGVAITLSAFVRFLYHTHQGPFSIGTLLMGFMFGYLFWRYRELWPLIVAHSLVDFLGLLLLAGKL